MKSKILYVGDLWYGSTALMRLEALRRIGHPVTGIDSSVNKLNRVSFFLMRVFNKFFRRLPDFIGVNKQIRVATRGQVFEILWIDKGLSISPKTLIDLKLINDQLKLIHYSPDDMLNPQNQTKYYLRSIPLFDLMVTTKSYNVAELSLLGAKQVFFSQNAYDPETHQPTELDNAWMNQYGASVGFIGGYEKDRADHIVHLVENGIAVTVYGNGWISFINRYVNLRVVTGDFYGLDYVKIICSIRINLSFLRKVNRDLQTQRSIEIPACGAFMLAERTQEHQRLFVEGEEADYFSSKLELVTKVNYYLSNPQEVDRIRKNGLRRCVESDYSYDARMGEIVDYADQQGKTL